MTEAPPRVSEVMAFAVQNRDLFGLLVNPNTNWEDLGLKDDRARACRAAGDHLIQQRGSIFRAINAEYVENRAKLGLPEQTPRLGLAASKGGFFHQLKGPLSVTFMLDPRVKMATGKTTPKVQLFVAIYSSKKRHEVYPKLSQVMEREGRVPRGTTVCKEHWNPRWLWHAVDIDEGDEHSTIAASVMDSFDECWKMIRSNLDQIISN